MKYDPSVSQPYYFSVQTITEYILYKKKFVNLASSSSCFEPLRNIKYGRKPIIRTDKKHWIDKAAFWSQFLAYNSVLRTLASNRVVHMTCSQGCSTIQQDELELALEADGLNSRTSAFKAAIYVFKNQPIKLRFRSPKITGTNYAEKKGSLSEKDWYCHLTDAQKTCLPVNSYQH